MPTLGCVHVTSRRMLIDFPDDASMRVSHEAIYQSLYVQGRGALRRDLCACLRTGRALRVPRARTRQRGKQFITPELMISRRPPEVADRAVAGHWEGDLNLPPMVGHGSEVRLKNGPALAGHGAEAVRDAIAAKIATLPEQLCKSLTWDQGAEMPNGRVVRYAGIVTVRQQPETANGTHLHQPRGRDRQRSGHRLEVAAREAAAAGPHCVPGCWRS